MVTATGKRLIVIAMSPIHVTALSLPLSFSPHPLDDDTLPTYLVYR